MPRKTVGIGRKPTQKADDWVSNTDPVEAPPPPSPTPTEPEPPRSPKPTIQKPKRLTLDIDPALHKRLKIAALQQDTTMVDLVRDLLEKEFPE